MLTTHIKARKYFWYFLSFANWFYGFADFCFVLDFTSFCFLSCIRLKAVKIHDTSYLSWGPSPKLASGSLLLVRVKAPPTAVGPPLLLLLQLPLLHGVESFVGVTLPCLGCVDVLV